MVEMAKRRVVPGELELAPVLGSKRDPAVGHFCASGDVAANEPEVVIVARPVDAIAGAEFNPLGEWEA